MWKGKNGSALIKCSKPHMRPASQTGPAFSLCRSPSRHLSTLACSHKAIIPSPSHVIHVLLLIYRPRGTWKAELAQMADPPDITRLVWLSGSGIGHTITFKLCLTTLLLYSTDLGVMVTTFGGYTIRNFQRRSDPLRLAMGRCNAFYHCWGRYGEFCEVVCPATTTAGTLA